MLFIAEVVRTIVEVGVASARGQEPPTLDALSARIDTAITTHREAWLARAQADANQTEQAAADAAFKSGGAA
jgi:hypothetical protein